MEKSRSMPDVYSSSFSYSSGLEGLGYDRSKSYNFNGPSGKKDGFQSSNDPELKRKRRIASYNMFTMEANLKSSVRNSMKWIKAKISDVRYGF